MMGAGSKVIIRDGGGVNDTEARVQGMRLWVDANISGSSGCIDLCAQSQVNTLVDLVNSEVVHVGEVTEAGVRTNPGNTDDRIRFPRQDEQGASWVRDKADVQVGDDLLAFTPWLQPPAVVRDDALSVIPEVEGEWTHLRCASRGTLWVQGLDLVGYSVATAGQAFATAIAAERDDALTTLAELDGEWTTFRTNSKGALWVQQYVPTDHLSGSTNGRPIQIAAGASPGTLIHTATSVATEVDKVWLWFTNAGLTQNAVKVEWGAAGAANEIDILVPANDTILGVAGVAIGGAAGLTIRAYAAGINLTNVFGHVERVSIP